MIHVTNTLSLSMADNEHVLKMQEILNESGSSAWQFGSLALAWQFEIEVGPASHIDVTRSEIGIHTHAHST